MFVTARPVRVVSVLVTYVGVEAGTVATMAPPDRVRSHLGEAAGEGG